MQDIADLVGYERIAALESELLSAEQLARKYQEGLRDYVVKEH